MKLQPGLIYLLFALLFISSCKKEEIFEIESSSSFIKSSKETIGIVRVFTGNGEVTDQYIVQRHINLNSTAFNSISNSLLSATGRMDTIKFTDSKNAKVYDNYRYADYAVTQQKNDIILSGTQVIHSGHYGDLFTKSPAYQVCQYLPPIYAEYLISSTAGNYYFGYDTKNQFVLNSEKGVLQASYIIMMVNYPVAYSSRSYTVQNKPDFNFYKSLTPADTVVLQQFAVNYKKY